MTVSEFPKTKGGPSGNGPQLPTERIGQIRQRLRKHLDDNEDLSQAKVAKKVGYSGAVITTFLSATYAGDNGAVAHAVDRYLELHDQKRTIGRGPEFVRTSISRRIEYAFALAETTGKIAIVSTSSGLGKSRTILSYRERNPNCVYVSCSPDLTSKAGFLSELHLALTREPEKRMSPSHARRQVVESLVGTGRPLIIDESHYLTQEVVDVIRCIHDQAEVPVILSGNESTYEGRFSRRGAAHQSLPVTAYTQFASRVVARLSLSATDIKASDIRLVACQMVPEAVVAETLERLQYEAINAGGFRRIVTICQLAQMFAGAKPITKGHVLRAIEELHSLGGDE